MAMSPEPMSTNPLDFRAPPPSPIGTGRRSCVTNDDVLTDFLEHSLRVPDLVLPDKIFPRQKFIQNPPTIDFQSLRFSNSDAISKMSDSLSSIGCFQLINHGIPSELVGSVSSAAAAGVFGVSPEKKMAVARSPEKPYGFDEYYHGDEESELIEEFIWSKNEDLKLEMEAISPFGYSNFSKKMEELTEAIEKMGEKMLRIFQENSPRKSKVGVEDQVGIGSVCCVYKQRERFGSDEWENSLKYEVIRMLIRGSDLSHALCFHVSNGSSEFHVYSKRGWVSFEPDEQSILVTAGDQIQAWSGGQYKHVIGRPIYRDYKEDAISMAFLYSPTSSIASHSPNETIISLPHQALIAIFFTLFYNFLVYIFK